MEGARGSRRRAVGLVRELLLEHRAVGQHDDGVRGVLHRLHEAGRQAEETTMAGIMPEAAPGGSRPHSVSFF